jgi:hypothetical protein
MTEQKNASRLVGVLYFAMAGLAAMGLTFFPSHFIVPRDPAATVARIESATTYFRLWALADLVSGVLSMWLGIAMYRLFKDVDRSWARFLAGILFVMPAMYFAVMLLQLAPLTILNGADYWSAFSRDQLVALANGFLSMRQQAVGAVSAYWGIWLIPVAALTYKSGFLPRLIGVLLGVAAIAYIVSAIVFFVAPSSYRIVFWAAAPLYGAGEVTFISYVLVKGVRQPRMSAA